MSISSIHSEKRLWINYLPLQKIVDSTRTGILKFQCSISGLKHTIFFIDAKFYIPFFIFLGVTQNIKTCTLYIIDVCIPII